MLGILGWLGWGRYSGWGVQGVNRIDKNVGVRMLGQMNKAGWAGVE